MDIDHHDQKHCCKVCARCFPCGRSLGGHMRSHMPSSSSFDPDDKPSPPPPPPPHSNTKSKSYVLRDNPKKSCRLPSSSSSSSIEECFNPCCYSSEIEEEQEEDDVALILMMLSRDTASSSWIGGFNHESSDKNSIVFEDNARDYDVSDNEYNSLLTHAKKRKNRCRYRYQCRACSKSFDTYQALGGHRASHKRSDKGSKKMIESVECPPLKKVKKQHQCSICLKVFSSGQALGGHKRSHIAAAAAAASAATNANTDTDTEVVLHQKELESSPLMSELLDLNVPAVAAADDDDHDDGDDVHVDEESNNNSIHVNGAESWGNGNLD